MSGPPVLSGGRRNRRGHWAPRVAAAAAITIAVVLLVVIVWAGHTA